MQKFNYQKSNKAAGKIYIGLDHGYGNIKTAHRVFQTGIECYDEEPIVSTNYVKYRDKYYVIGESHVLDLYFESTWNGKFTLGKQ